MRKAFFSLASIFIAAAVGCDSSSPNSPAQKTAMRDDSQVTLEKMEAQNPALTNQINTSYGYAVFPDIGSAAVGIGGASGRGIVYRGGQRVGEIKMNQASIGFQLGGDTFGELIVFQDEHALNRMMNNSVEFGADANATIIKAGAGAAANFANGVAVYILPKGGLMAGVNVNGQKFHYQTAQDSSPH